MVTETLYPLSVIIITKNVEHYVRRCLDSVRWAGEIIVLDSGSTDHTLQICQEYTPYVYNTDWPGFGQQKNRALQKATQEWVLTIDADEWLSESLQVAIQKIITAPPAADAYSVPRRNIYCGQWLRFGEDGHDRLIRLFKRSLGKFKNNIVHEAVVLAENSKLVRLSQPLWHDSHRNLEQLIERMNAYSSLSAQLRHERGHESSFLKALIHGLWAFIYPYFFRLGFLDGKMGFIIAMLNAQGSYYRHLKLAMKTLDPL